MRALVVWVVAGCVLGVVVGVGLGIGRGPARQWVDSRAFELRPDEPAARHQRSSSSPVARRAAGDELDATVRESASASEVRENLVAADPQPNRVETLVSGGFSRERALAIVQTESRLRSAAIDREYAATGTIQPLNGSTSVAVEQQLRREMGDGEYEQYLSAIGRTTRVPVGDVEADSAAANAGIQAGDEILAYDGRRVFTSRDLNALMLQTPEGSTVKATVIRNGQALDLYVTGGALGISQPMRVR